MKSATLTLPLLLPVALISCGLDPEESAEAQSDVKLNTKRYEMTARMTDLCWDPVGLPGPHDRAEVDLFTNEVALAYRKQNPETFDYPIGSAFRKLKYRSVGADEPDLETSMERIAENGGVDDWHFRMRELPSGRILSDNDASCLDCHEGFERRGFVSYVSEQYLQRLLQPRLGGEQDGADQPATAPESKPEADSKPQPESEGRSQ